MPCNGTYVLKTKDLVMMKHLIATKELTTTGSLIRNKALRLYLVLSQSHEMRK